MPLRSLFLAAILALSLHGIVSAEGPIYAVQDALKREQFFTGERTGVLDPPTRSALRLFQARHGLPDTGEIDTDTLQALQSSAQPERAVISSLPPATAESAPSDSIVKKDREFLRNLEALENGREQETTIPSGSLASSERPPGPASNPDPIQAPENAQSLQPAPHPAAAVVPQFAPSPSPDQSTQPARKPEVAKPNSAKSRSGDKSRSVARQKFEKPNRAQSADLPISDQSELEPVGSAPPRRVERRIPRDTSRIVEIEDDPDPLDSGGVRIIRPTTTRTPDGRIYKRTTVYPDTDTTNLRQAEPAEPRRKRVGIFDRIFNDDDD